MELVRHNILQLARYGVVTVLSYVTLLAGTYIGVDILGFKSTPTYVVMLTLVYVGVYFLSSRYVFEVANPKQHIHRFVYAILCFWALNSVTFYVLDTKLGVQYLIAAIVNIVVFGCLRFLVNKYWVFRNNESLSETKPV